MCTRDLHLITQNVSRYCIENHNYTLILFYDNFPSSFDKSNFSNINSIFSTFEHNF